MQKEGVSKVLLLCLGLVLLIGIVSAWSVDITKLNNNVPTNYYSAKVTKMSYQFTGIACANITGVWYTLDNEEIINAVKRELKEETGQSSSNIQQHNFSGKYLYKKEFQDRGKIIGQTFSLYSAEIKNAEVVLDEREHSDYLWLSDSEAHKKLKYENQKKSLEIVNNFLQSIFKFREFKTSSGKLVLAGKNAENNEELVVQVQPEEDVFHTAKPGSPFVNIKDKNSSNDDIKESAIFCAAKSQDWRNNKSDVKVHLFKGKDILKIKGMKLGTFEVKNKKDILIKKHEIEKFLREHSNL